MGVRRKAREAACQLLYQMDILEEWDERHIAPFWALIEPGPARESRKYAEGLVRGVMAEREKLDHRISSTAKNWAMERMNSVDRNILRAAAWEIAFERLPPGVVIDEWVEVAKKYGTDQSPAFINGILDKIAKDEAA